MTSLILKLTEMPRFDGLRRSGKAFNELVVVIAEAKQMARDAQRRYPFAIE